MVSHLYWNSIITSSVKYCCHTFLSSVITSSTHYWFPLYVNRHCYQVIHAVLLSFLSLSIVITSSMQCVLLSPFSYCIVITSDIHTWLLSPAPLSTCYHPVNNILLSPLPCSVVMAFSIQILLSPLQFRILITSFLQYYYHLFHTVLYYYNITTSTR